MAAKLRPFSISGKLFDEEETAKEDFAMDDAGKENMAMPDAAKEDARTPDAAKEDARTPDAAIGSSTESRSDFWSFISDDDEHSRAEESHCLSERLLAFRPLFPVGTEFCFDQASRRICVVTDRYSSRSGSIVLIKPM